MRAIALTAFLAGGLGGAAAAQGVVVAPHAIYLDHRTRSGAVTLYNPGADPVEVSLGFLYGYAVTDSLGDFALATPEPVDDTMPSAAGFIEAFPRRMTLPPLTRQTVRLLARPPAGLADGEYWARLVVTARGGSVPVTGADTGTITIGLSLELRTIIPVTYRKGVLETGLRIAGLETELAGDSLVMRPHLERTGRAAYIGTARGALTDPRDRVVARFEEPIAVYYHAEPRFTLPVRGLPAGTYGLRLEFTSERQDLDPKLLLRSPPVRDSVTVTLP
ncbi:MAG TPA: hypothetical protein VNJ71_05515 [Gemmatimonadales bacterium]|jgi:hypothetical protein|nr:hypothetical protein [Gemmatimonadales bacterium]